MTPGADPQSNSQWIVAEKVNPFQAAGVESSHGGVRFAAARCGESMMSNAGRHCGSW
jgi:hypothetical protein